MVISTKQTFKHKQKIFSGLLLLVLALAACGENPTPTVTGGFRLQTVNPTSQAANLSPAASGNNATAVPFFTPVAPTVGNYLLAFDYDNNNPILEAAWVSPNGSSSDWRIEISNEGAVKFTLNPRDKAKAQVQEHYLSREKLDALLPELDKLAVLSWPDTTPPDKIKPDGVQRNLFLGLKGRPKKITDLTGTTNDGLAQILNLLKENVERAPLRNSP